MNSTRMLVRALRGPMLLTTLGALFAIDYFGAFPFYRTWPVLLIVYGALWLLERVVRDTEIRPGSSPFGGTV